MRRLHLLEHFGRQGENGVFVDGTNYSSLLRGFTHKALTEGRREIALLIVRCN